MSDEEKGLIRQVDHSRKPDIVIPYAELVAPEPEPECKCPGWWFPGIPRSELRKMPPDRHHGGCPKQHAKALVVPSLPVPVGPDPRGELFFSRYPDGSLRLYPKNSYIGDAPAGYSENPVTVKVMVKRPNEEFMVVIPVTRERLDQPGAEEWLANVAWEHRK